MSEGRPGRGTESKRERKTEEEGQLGGNECEAEMSDDPGPGSPVRVIIVR